MLLCIDLTQNGRFLNKLIARRAIAALSSGLLVSGCAFQPLALPEQLDQSRNRSLSSASLSGPSATGRVRVEDAPAVPAKPAQAIKTLPAPSPASGSAAADISLNFVNLPLPAFVQTFYGEILKKNVTIDPKVLDRRELVTLRSGGEQTPEQVEHAVKLLLKTYGIAAIDFGGLVRVVPDTAELGYLPDLRRGSALPETPLPLRPHFYLATVRSVLVSDVVNWIKTIYGNKVVFHGDQTRNSILLSGTPDNLKAVLETIDTLDQPVMFGRKSMRINPQFWSADELARRLSEILLSEGYALAAPSQTGNLLGPGGVRYPISILPIAGINAVLVFSTDESILAHVREWSDSLDRPNERGIGKGYFTYAAQHTDASKLADTLEKLIVGSSPAAIGTTASQQTATSTANRSNTTGNSTRRAVVVDQASNTLIFQVSADEFPQLRALAISLDRPAKEVLIEVTVAEVTLTDNSQLGFEWLFDRTLSDGNSIVGGTLDGLGLGKAGFILRGYNAAGILKAKLNALASTNQASILSSPRVVARNGEPATIEVGQEVPIITSQQSTLANAGTTPANTGVLQTVQYRNTGVILKVKPVIHSNDRVDLEVSQEVSAAESTLTGVNNSPTFGKRKIETRLSLKNGATVLLGGLISSTGSDGSAGVPLLKDIPLLGNLFSNNSFSKTKTELIVLITPYIIADDQDAVDLTTEFRKQLEKIVVPKVSPGAKGRDKEQVEPTRPSTVQ